MTQYVRPMDLHAHNDGCELYGCIAVEPVTDRSVNFERAAAYQRELESKLDAIRLKCEHEIKLDQRTPPFAEGRMDFADVIWRMIVQEPSK